MRAIRVREYGAPSVLKVEHNVPIPEPADNQVLIRVKAVGINPVEALTRAGYVPMFGVPPYTPGKDSTGIIEKVGAAVKRFKKGDRVFTIDSVSGTYAEYATAFENRTFPLPDNISFEQGTGLCVPYFTATRAIIHNGQLKPEHKLLVRGASGPVGQACVEIARRMGVKEIVGTAGTEEAIKRLSDPSLLGPNNVINHRSPGYHDELKKRFPKGADMIVEVLVEANLSNDLELIAHGGTILVIGSRGPTNGINGQRIMLSECRIIGVQVYNMTDEQYAATGREIFAGASDGSFKPIISKTFTLEQAPQAHEMTMSESKVPGRIALIV